MITGDNWPLVSAEGWRLVENLSGDVEEDYLRVGALIQIYGSNNIALGTRFVDFSPRKYTPLCGLAVYVRDTEDLVSELYEDMLNLEHGHPLPIGDILF